MEIGGQSVNIRLSRPGTLIVQGLLGASLGRKRTFQAMALSSDSNGVWIENRRLSDDELEILLIRWDYIEALGFVARIAEPEQPRFIGFGKS